MKNRKLAKIERRLARKSKGKPSSCVRQMEYEQRIKDRNIKKEKDRLNRERDRLEQERKLFDSEIVKIITDKINQNSSSLFVSAKISVPIPKNYIDYPSVKNDNSIYSFVKIENDEVFYRKVRRFINCLHCDHKIDLDIEMLFSMHGTIAIAILTEHAKNETVLKFSVVIERNIFSEFIVSSHKRIAKSNTHSFEIEKFDFKDTEIAVFINVVTKVKKRVDIHHIMFILHMMGGFGVRQ